jgi:hypothetical protein
MIHFCAGALLALSVAGCSSSSSQRSGAVRPGPNLITADEIGKAAVQNAFEAVQKLSPTMLRRQQPATMNAQARGEVIVYVDNTRYGAADHLRQIPASSIAIVRYFSASESQLKWGSGHPGGVIEVITKR